VKHHLNLANRERRDAAASTTVTRVIRALQILGDDVPETLAVAAKLRITHQRVSLAELAQLADPALTKDTVAGRLRRLLIMADERSAELERRS
jgi:DNA-binding protein WhiA